MGNQCENICCEGTDLKLGTLQSKNFYKLTHSKLVVENQFPEDLIPLTVKEKMKLLQIEPDLANSEIWKYEDDEIKTQDPYNVVYAIISNADIQNRPQNQSEQKIIVHKNVPSNRNEAEHPEKKELSSQQPEQNAQKKNNINPDRFQKATIFLFKSSEIGFIKEQVNQSKNPSIRTLTLEKVYHGPINSSMGAPDAIIILENGEYYKGNVDEFNFLGKGIITNSLGNHTYEGGWLDNKPHGIGVEQLTDKFKYEGDFIKGKWQGKGRLTLFQSLNKFIIDGTFLQGTIEGSGKVFNSSGQLVYDGMFKNGKQNGAGKWYGPYGQSYVGEFVQGKKQGLGKYTFKSGKEYEGHFKDDKPEGDGQIIEGSRIIKGYWYKGENVITKNEVEA